MGEGQARDWPLVYGAISARLDGRVPYPLPESRSATVFGRSHMLAIELLTEPNPDREDHGVSWLMNAITDARGWWETGAYKLSEGSFGHGWGNHLMYPFPAVRLAAIAVGSAYGECDFTAVWMKERADGHLVLNHPYFVLTWNFQLDPEQWDSMIAELSDFTERVPRHAEAWYVLGDFLVRRRRLDEAEQRLQTCLALRSCSGDTAASAWYDLACAYALQDREEACRQALLTSDALRPIDRSWIGKDEDLVRVRERTWFKELVGENETR
jgi:tetratricopeptide (TPR) repeat protein